MKYIITVLFLMIVGCIHKSNVKPLPTNYSAGFTSKKEMLETIHKAESGDVNSMLKLGKYYRYGLYYPDREKSEYWYKKANRKTSNE